MIRSILIFILAAAAMWGQTQSPAPPPSPAQPSPSATTPAPAPQPATPPSPQITLKPATPPAQPESASKVAPTAAVITIKGICSNGPAKRPATTAARKTAPAAASTGTCQTVITREEFEKLIQSVNPNLPPAMRRNVAQAYVELMAFAQAAEKAGVENDPKFKEQIRLMRLQALASIYRRDLEDKSKNPSPQDIQAYYNQNLPKYEEIKLDRIFIPAKNPSSPAKDDWEKKAEQAANDIHDRAAKGEDFEKLQKEAYTTLGLTIAPPNTSVGTRRRGMLAPAEEQELFALKAGDVSKVEQEPAGYIIYKVESKQTLSPDQVKDEISRELSREKMESQMKSINSSVKADLNDQYFGAPNTPPAGMVPGAQPPGGPVPRPAAPAPAHAPAPATPPQAPPK
jgi:parvulin-like peptidyl-prolyl isomerase